MAKKKHKKRALKASGGRLMSAVHRDSAQGRSQADVASQRAQKSAQMGEGSATSPSISAPLIATALTLTPLYALTWLEPFKALPHASQALRWASALALLFALFLGLRDRSAGRSLHIKASLRRPHWVQLLMHSAIFVYWGAHYELVREMAPLILAQIPLAYALDFLLSWWRRGVWRLGFGPVPIIGSINLFLWFKAPYYAWQLAMVTLAFVGREFITWRAERSAHMGEDSERGEGRPRHIINPSALALSVASLVLIITDQSELTWGQEIATRLLVAPHMFELIFAVGLVVQLLFGVGATTMAAASTLWLLNALWTAMTGEWFFVDTAIPVSVFLGMNLLITDPATSPKSAVGKGLFGALYGAMVFPLFSILPIFQQPAFYDKLLQVPLCNVLAPTFERVGRRIERRCETSALKRLSSLFQGRRLVLVWGLLFLALRPSLIDHPGARPELWRARCEAGELKACLAMRHSLEKGCGIGELARCYQLAERLNNTATLTPNPRRARQLWSKACEGGHQESCARLDKLNTEVLTRAQQLTQASVKQTRASTQLTSRAAPRDVMEAKQATQATTQATQASDLTPATPHLIEPPLRPNVQQEGQKNSQSLTHQAPQVDEDTFELMRLDQACTHSDKVACLALAQRLIAKEHDANPQMIASAFERACRFKEPRGCVNLGLMYLQGRGVLADPTKARELHERACELDYIAACGRLGLLQWRGIGGSQDSTAALRSFQRACSGGDQESCAFVYQLTK